MKGWPAKEVDHTIELDSEMSSNSTCVDSLELSLEVWLVISLEAEDETGVEVDSND